MSIHRLVVAIVILVGGRTAVVVGQHSAGRPLQLRISVGGSLHLPLPDSPEHGRHDRRALTSNTVLGTDDGPLDLLLRLQLTSSAAP